MVSEYCVLQVIFLAILVAFIMRKPIEEEKMTINLDSVKKQAKAYTPKLDNQFMGTSFCLYTNCHCI